MMFHHFAFNSQLSFPLCHSGQPKEINELLASLPGSLVAWKINYCTMAFIGFPRSFDDLINGFYHIHVLSLFQYFDVARCGSFMLEKCLAMRPEDQQDQFRTRREDEISPRE